MNKRVLITGGAGFISSHLADELLGHGYSVRVLDRVIAISRREFALDLAERFGAAEPPQNDERSPEVYLNGMKRSQQSNRARWIRARDTEHFRWMSCRRHLQPPQLARMDS